MPVWPKFVHRCNLSLRTAATRRKLDESRSAAAHQDAAFRALTQRLAATTFWKQHGVESGTSYSRFQSRVPLQSYRQIAPAVDQMKRGDKDVLWPGDCRLFGLTAGTTRGSPKVLPMTDDLLAHFRSKGGEALLFFAARRSSTGVS